MSRKSKLVALIWICFVLSSWLLVLASAGQSSPEIRTPKPPPAPHINGPKVYGARPGHFFLYRIPCTGQRPIHFSVKDLPASLRLDAETGIISGSTPLQTGEYPLTIHADNSKGRDSRPLKLVVGDTLGLTPQMGWNSWYALFVHPTDSDIRKAADAMIASGMADYGYQFVDIDGGWERIQGSVDPQLGGPTRDANGNILANGRFPDMQSLTTYIHSLGLKAGIYSSPGPRTCGDDRWEGSYQHEDADARQFAAWGFDLLKYDWCTYGDVAKEIPGEEIGKLFEASNNADSLAVSKSTLEALERPYIKMGNILKGLDRDVVFNMCQYGFGEVWKWGSEVGGNSWRTTGDLGSVHHLFSERGDSLPGFYHVGFANAELSAYAGPGHWNDPDYILIGTVGSDNGPPAVKTRLTPAEQYSYMSMWSLMASPLFFSGDMTKLDEFTLNILCNSEVIDIDQDALGRQAKIVRKTDKEFILAKPLEDGSVAVGLFNLTEQPITISVNYGDVGVSGREIVRDVWRQKNIGIFANRFHGQVGAHDVLLVKLSRP